MDSGKAHGFLSTDDGKPDGFVLTENEAGGGEPFQGRERRADASLRQTGCLPFPDGGSFGQTEEEKRGRPGQGASGDGHAA